MATDRIEFFWDAASPYTYLASTQIESVAADCGAELIWRPFLLGAVFQATGNQTPANIPAKGKHLSRDLRNWASYYGVPFRFPENFPVNSMQAQRAGVAAGDQARGALFARNVMYAHWAEGRDIGDPQVLANVITDTGLDSGEIATRVQEQSIKDRLKANTDEAVERGAFGAPTLFVGDTMFWGNDRLELLRAHLDGELTVS